MSKTTPLAASKTPMSFARLRLIDSLISGTGRYYCRQELLDAVNRCIDIPICIFTLDKDIRCLKDLLADLHEGVRLRKTSVRGYHYTTEGEFSVFPEKVCERDVRNLLLLLEFLSSKHPDFYPEMIETITKLTEGCPFQNGKELFDKVRRRHQRLHRDRKEYGIMKRVRDSCHEEQAIRASVKGHSGETVELVVSPLELVSVSGELWLACTLHAERGKHSFALLPAASIDDIHHTDERYRTTYDYAKLIEEDFDAHILTHVKRREHRRKTTH